MTTNRRRLLLLTVLVAVASTSLFSYYRAPAAPYDGLWEGNFDINGKGNYKFTALYVNGVAIGHSADARVIYKGGISIENKRYRSDMDMFFMAGSPMDTVTLEGILSEDKRIDATYQTHGAGDTGKLVLHRLEAADKNASHARVADSWILYQGFSILKLDIDQAGIVSGGNTSGCAYDGRIKPVSSAYNAYDIDLVITSCDNLNGTWNGMAYLADGVVPGDTLNLHLFEEDWAMLLPIVRNTDTRLIDERKEWKPGMPFGGEK